MQVGAQSLSALLSRFSTHASPPSGTWRFLHTGPLQNGVGGLEGGMRDGGNMNRAEWDLRGQTELMFQWFLRSIYWDLQRYWSSEILCSPIYGCVVLQRHFEKWNFHWGLFFLSSPHTGWLSSQNPFNFNWIPQGGRLGVLYSTEWRARGGSLFSSRAHFKCHILKGILCCW